MKLFGALLAACAAAAVIPYRVEIDKESKSLRLKSLTYELEASTTEDGEKSVKINILPSICRECEDAEDPEHEDAVMCDENCDTCEDIFSCPKDAEVAAEAGTDAAEDAAEPELDERFAEAAYLAIEEGKISTSLIQRKLGVGYGRASRMIGIMEKMGIVSPPEGRSPRAVLVTKEELDALLKK